MTVESTVTRGCVHAPWSLSSLAVQGRGMRAGMHQTDIGFSLRVSSPRAGTSPAWVPILAHALALPAVNWLDHGRTLREQGIDDNETLLLRRKFFYSDQNVDSRDPVQLNLLYVQVQLPRAPGLLRHTGPLAGVVAEVLARSHHGGGTSGCPVISWVRATAGNPSPALCIIHSS